MPLTREARARGEHVASREELVAPAGMIDNWLRTFLDLSALQGITMG